MTSEHKEALRHAALRFLAVRQRASFSIGQAYVIMKSIRAVHFPFTEDDLADAFTFLVGMKLVSTFRDGLGITAYFQATSEGVLSRERHDQEIGLEED